IDVGQRGARSRYHYPNSSSAKAVPTAYRMRASKASPASRLLRDEPVVQAQVIAQQEGRAVLHPRAIAVFVQVPGILAEARGVPFVNREHIPIHAVSLALGLARLADMARQRVQIDAVAV